MSELGEVLVGIKVPNLKFLLSSRISFHLLICTLSYVLVIHRYLEVLNINHVLFFPYF